MKNNYNLFTTFLWLIFCLISTVAEADDLLLPKPQQFISKSSDFVLNRINLRTPVLQQEWTDFVVEHGGYVDIHANSVIEVIIVPSLNGVLINQEEAYRMTVNKQKIEIEAVTERGVYWAMQTLAQLADKSKKRTSFHGCEILDWPAFRIRGFMQDVGRSYLPLEELKREIAILSKFKINVFHWHLTEN